MLVEAGKLSNTNSYQDVMLVACGRPGFYLLTILQFIYPFIGKHLYRLLHRMVWLCYKLVSLSLRTRVKEDCVQNTRYSMVMSNLWLVKRILKLHKNSEILFKQPMQYPETIHVISLYVKL